MKTLNIISRDFYYQICSGLGILYNFFKHLFIKPSAYNLGSSIQEEKASLSIDKYGAKHKQDFSSKCLTDLSCFPRKLSLDKKCRTIVCVKYMHVKDMPSKAVEKYLNMFELQYMNVNHDR